MCHHHNRPGWHGRNTCIVTRWRKKLYKRCFERALVCVLQNTERRYEQTFANARKPGSAAGAGGASVDTQGLRKDAHGNIIQVGSPRARIG